jgi:hypothetical protein
MSDTNSNDNFFVGKPADHHGDLPNPPKGGPNPEERERMVADATKQIAAKFKTKPLSDPAIVVQKAKSVQMAIVATAKMLLEAEREQRKPNREIAKAMREALTQTYREEFWKNFSREEITELCTHLHVGIVLEGLGLYQSGG